MPLLEHGYLRVMDASDPDNIIVARPLPAAMDWLRTMFAPLPLRPFFPVAHAAEFLDLTLEEVREICLEYGVPLYLDPVFGELLSISGFNSFFGQLHRMRNPVRFDRQAIMVLLAGIKRVGSSGNKRKRSPPLRYSRRLEQEISRIVKLPEPERTIRGTAFFIAYRDADTITECFGNYKASLALRRIEEKVTHLGKILEGKNPFGYRRFLDRNAERSREAHRALISAMALQDGAAPSPGGPSPCDTPNDSFS